MSRYCRKCLFSYPAQYTKINRTGRVSLCGKLRVLDSNQNTCYRTESGWKIHQWRVTQLDPKRRCGYRTGISPLGEIAGNMRL